MVSDWERVTVVNFFLQSLMGVENQEGEHYFVSRLNLVENITIPDSLARLGLLLGMPTDKRDRCMVSHGSASPDTDMLTLDR